MSSTSAQPEDITIVEVESNPAGVDSGNEWVELYVPQNLSASFFVLENNDGDTIELTGNFSAGYFVYTFESGWLDNSDEKVMLKLLDVVVSETPVFADSDNDESTLQLCGTEWIEAPHTPGTANDCPEEPEETAPEDTVESEQTTTESETTDEEPEDEVQAENEETDEPSSTTTHSPEPLQLERKESSAVQEQGFIIERIPTQNQPIILNEPVETAPIQETTYLSRDGLVQRLMIGGFIFLLIVLVSLIILRRT